MAIITRFVDNIGRLVLPKEFRDKLGFSSKTKVFLSEENGKIIITVAERMCKLCGTKKDLSDNVELCIHCINKIKAI